MNPSAISSLLSAQQAATAAEARALVLRVGQELTATLLEMVDENLATLDLGNGQHLTARLQTDQLLVPGQTVQLVAADVRPEQITLRLVTEDMLTGPPGQQALRALGLKDDALNRAVLVALVSEGLPVTSEAIQALRQQAAALDAEAPEDMHAVAYLMARGLPLTASLLQVVRDGQALGADLRQLQADLHDQAAALAAALDEAPEEGGSPLAELRNLLAQLVSSDSPQQGKPDPAVLQSFLEQLTVSVEAALAAVVDSDRSALADKQPEPSQNGPQAEAGLPAAQTPASGSGAPSTTPAAESAAGEAGAPQADAAALSKGGIPAQAAAPALPEGAVAGQVTGGLSVAAPDGSQEAAGSLPGEAPDAPVQAGAAASSAESALAEPVQSMAAPPPQPGSEAPVLPRLAVPIHGGETGVAPSAHEVARRLLPALERALQSGGLPSAAVAAGTELRHTAERFVHAVQFQHIETMQQPTAAEPYIVVPLPVPSQHGEGDLWLYVRDGEAGAPKIDPNDVRLVIDLRLSQLRRVRVTVHAYQRQLTLQIETDSLGVQRLLEAGAPELRDSLRELGYAVEPIHCSVAGMAQRDAVTEVALPISKLGSLNVTA